MGKSTRFAIEYAIMTKPSKNVEPSDQGKRFAEAARELGCDEDESHFEEALKKVARHKPPPDAPPEPKPPKTKKPGQ
jgi:hypothetical protein